MANINSSGPKFTIETIDNLSPKLEQVAKSAKKAKKEIDDLGNEIDDLNRKTSKSRLTPLSYTTDLTGKITGVQKYQGANSKYTTGTMTYEQFKSTIGGQSIAELKRIDAEARKTDLRQQVLQRQNLKTIKELNTSPSLTSRDLAFDKIRKPLTASQKLRQQELAYKEAYGSSISVSSKQAQMNAMFAQNERMNKESAKLVAEQTKKEIDVRNESLDIARKHNKEYAKTLSDKIKKEKKDNIKFRTEQDKIHRRSAKERENLEKKFNREVQRNIKAEANAPFSAIKYRTDLRGNVIGISQTSKMTGFNAGMYSNLQRTGSKPFAETIIDPEILRADKEAKREAKRAQREIERQNEMERKARERADRSSFIGTSKRAFRYLGAYKVASTLQEAPGKTFDTMKELDSLRNSLKAILASKYNPGQTKEQDIINANKEVEYLYGLSQRFGVDIRAIAPEHRRMLGAGGKDAMPLDKIRAVTEAGALYSALYGLNPSQTSNLMVGFSQVLSKGQVYSEEVNQQINEQVPGFYKSLLLATNMAINDPVNSHKYAQYRGKINKESDVIALMKDGLLGAGVMPYLKQANEQMFGEKLDDKLKSLSSEFGRLGSSITEMSDLTTKKAVPAFSLFARTINQGLQLAIKGMKDNEGNIDYYNNIVADPNKTIGEKTAGVSMKLGTTLGTSAAVGLATKYAIKYGAALFGKTITGGLPGLLAGGTLALGTIGYDLYKGAKDRAENLPEDERSFGEKIFATRFYNERKEFDKIWNRKSISYKDFMKQNYNSGNVMDMILQQTPILPKQQIELVLKIEGDLPNGFKMTPAKTNKSPNTYIDFTFDMGNNLKVGGVGGY